MRCDVIAMGVINAAQNIGMKKPIIVRLKGTSVHWCEQAYYLHLHLWWLILIVYVFYYAGTNVEEAKKLIEASGFKMIVTDDLEDAADKAVHVADIVRQAEEVKLEVSFSS